MQQWQRRIQDLEGWLVFRHDRRRRRELVAAARARVVPAIGQDGFAGMQHQRTASPVNIAAHAIRDIRQAWLRQPDDPGRCDVEVRVVGANDGIGFDRSFERLSRARAAGDDRVRKYRAILLDPHRRVREVHRLGVECQRSNRLRRGVVELQVRRPRQAEDGPREYQNCEHRPGKDRLGAGASAPVRVSRGRQMSHTPRLFGNSSAKGYFQRNTGKVADRRFWLGRSLAGPLLLSDRVQTLHAITGIAVSHIRSLFPRVSRPTIGGSGCSDGHSV